MEGTLTAFGGPWVEGKGRLSVRYMLTQASSSMSALRSRFSFEYGSGPPVGQSRITPG